MNCDPIIVSLLLEKTFAYSVPFMYNTTKKPCRKHKHKTTKVNDVEVMSHSAFLIEGHCPQAALFFRGFVMWGYKALLSELRCGQFLIFGEVSLRLASICRQQLLKSSKMAAFAVICSIDDRV